MLKNRVLGWVGSLAVLAGILAVSIPAAAAQERLRLSCSAQIYTAFVKEAIDSFSKENGIEVEPYVASSVSAVYRLMNDFSDFACTSRALYRRHRDYGYVQIPFCRDPLAIVTRTECNVDHLTEGELRAIFSGDITNWKELGGADLPITVVVPGKETAANKNFRQQVMKHENMKYDFMTYQSTMALEALRYFPCGTISFISRGAAVKYKDIKALKIDGRSPQDEDYPYYQVFYFISKGEPAGWVRKFIDFSMSADGQAIMKKNGMLPVVK